MKAFKYFDLDNSGYCSPKEFLKTVLKIGITSFTDENLLEIFNHYDVDQSGGLDYKEFTAIITGNPVTTKKVAERMDKAPKRSEYEKDMTKAEYLKQDDVTTLLEKIRSKLAARGVRGICSIGRNFRIVDDNNSQTLDYEEFCKACKDFRFDLNAEEMKKVFLAFDRTGDGLIDYDEYLRTIRGEMNDFRRNLVTQAFNILDKDGSGVIDMEEMKMTYNARKHPDVRQGRKTEDEVIQEFMETFEMTHNYLNGTECDSNINLDEFMEYYENVSMSIDDDEYFELMMANAWGLPGNTTYNNKKAGWSNKANKPLEENQGKPKNIQEGYNKRFGDEAPSRKTPVKSNKMQQREPEEEDYQDYSEERCQKSCDGECPFSKIRCHIMKQGPKVLMNLANQLNRQDDARNKQLPKANLNTALKYANIPVNQEDIKKIFDELDKKKTGAIDYRAFLSEIRGQMPENRLEVVLKAFDKMDIERSGIIDINDIKKGFNAKNDPDVQRGIKTENQVYDDFIQAFEQHHIINKGIRDKRVTKDEFVDFYNDLSMFTEDDEEFIDKVVASWKLGQTKRYGYPKQEENPYNKKYDYMDKYQEPKKKSQGRSLGDRYNKAGTSENAPFDTNKEPLNYSTSSKNYSVKQDNYPQQRGGMNQPYVKESRTPKMNDDPLMELREKLAKRGVRGLMALKRVFDIVDKDGNKVITLDEFEDFCIEYRLEISQEQIEKLFERFDRDNSGYIDFDEFIYGVVGEMNDYRMDVVKKCFNKLDFNHQGKVLLKDVRQLFDPSMHPDVVFGKKSEEEVLAEFLDSIGFQFDKRKEYITLNDFIEYYNSISMSIPSDSYFATMMYNVYQMEHPGFRK